MTGKLKYYKALMLNLTNYLALCVLNKYINTKLYKLLSINLKDHGLVQPTTDEENKHRSVHHA